LLEERGVLMLQLERRPRLQLIVENGLKIK
jgi:hypothetical protein